MKHCKPQWFRMLLLVTGSALFMLPAAWMVATALKPVEQTMSLPPRWLPYAFEYEVDGVVREVGVAPGVDAAHEQFAAAFQWKVNLGGEEVPVKRIDRGGMAGEDTVEVGVSMRTEAVMDGRPQAVRVRAKHAEGSFVEVVVQGRDAVPVVRRFAIADLVDRFNTTKEAVRHPYSRMVRRDVPADAVRRHVIDWGQRETLPFVFTQQRRVGAEPLRRRVRPRLENFPDALNAMGHFSTYLTNTVTLCVLTVVGAVVSSAVVAYGFSMIQWPGRDRVFGVVLATMMIPFPVTMVPLYGLFRELGWIGTLKPLWVPSFFAAAFNIFLLRQFFRRIPRELAEAARIDGCSEGRLLMQIIVPLARPALAVVALFQFLATWNDFLGPLIYLTDQQDFTIALGLQFFQRQHGGTQWHHLMAAATLLVVPVVFVFFAAQRTFIQGVSMTGLKG